MYQTSLRPNGMMYGAVDYYAERYTTRTPRHWVASRVMPGYSGQLNRCWQSRELGSRVTMEAVRCWMVGLSDSSRPAKNFPLDRVGHWDGTLRHRRPHRGHFFPRSRSDIWGIPERRSGLTHYTAWRWCYCPTACIRPGGTRRSRSFAPISTT